MKRLVWLALLLVGCSGASPPRPSEGESPPPVSVKTDEARLVALQPVVKLTGQVVPTETGTVQVTAPREGLVEPLVKVGADVAAGQSIARLNSVYGKSSLEVLDKLESDQEELVQAQARLSESLTRVTQARSDLGQAQSAVSEAQNDLSQADAELTYARVDLERKQALLDAGVFAQADVDQAHERFQRARASTEAAKTNLEIKKTMIPLARKNVGEFEANVNLAREAVRIAQANFERSKAVLGQSAVVGSSLPAGLSPVNLAGVRDQAAAAQASTFEVRSRIAGVVTDLNITQGSTVAAGTVLATVTNLTTVYVDANAFESDIPQLREGDALTVHSDAAPGKIFKGKVSYLGKVVNRETRAIQVRSLIENTGGTLRPATFVDVEITLPRKQEVLTVAEPALITAGDQEYVVVEKAPGDYERRKVVAGTHADGRVEIISGLKAGEKVVTEGLILLENRE